MIEMAHSFSVPTTYVSPQLWHLAAAATACFRATLRFGRFATGFAPFRPTGAPMPAWRRHYSSTLRPRNFRGSACNVATSRLALAAALARLRLIRHLPPRGACFAGFAFRRVVCACRPGGHTQSAYARTRKVQFMKSAVSMAQMG